MAGVVRLAGVPTTPRWFPPALPLLVQGGELRPILMSPCIASPCLALLSVATMAGFENRKEILQERSEAGAWTFQTA